jgi:hypothetical protein
MKTLRVFLSLLFLAVVLSFGFARLAKADEDSAGKCNCYIETSKKYGVNNPQGVCVADNDCFILIP